MVTSVVTGHHLSYKGFTDERLAQESAVSPSSESGPGPHPVFFPHLLHQLISPESGKDSKRGPCGDSGSPLLLELLRREKGNQEQQQVEKGVLGNPCTVILWYDIMQALCRAHRQLAPELGSEIQKARHCMVLLIGNTKNGQIQRECTE